MSRAYCYKCYRSNKTCLCGQIPIIDNDINVYVLQHPDEVKNAKGTSIIAKLYLKHYQSLQAEDFKQNSVLNELVKNQSDKTFVVYPAENSMTLDKWSEERGQLGKSRDAGKYNLIFIDASWRKAKKIWHSSPNLHRLKGISLTQHKESNYRIRKIPRPGYVSTIEAIAACLGYAEKNDEKYQPLLHVFDKMIDAQIDNMGEQIFQRHHQKK